MQQVIKDILLVDFYEKLAQDTTLVGIKELNLYAKRYYKVSLDDISCLTDGRCMFSTCPNYISILGRIYNFLETEYSYILEILLLGKGKISICGVSILYITCPGALFTPELYFDSSTVDEATDLLIKSLEILEKRLGCVDYQIEHNKLYFTYEHSPVCFFSLNIYKNKGELLRNIGPAPDRHGYNPTTGYFGTTSGALVITTKVFPIDFNWKHINLSRYSKCGIGVALHGFSKYFERGDIICTYNGKIEYHTSGIHTIFRQEDMETQHIPDGEILNNVPTMKLYQEICKPTKLDSWLPGYIPYVIGINNDRYVVLNNIKRVFNINNDIFKILCFYCLKAETRLAKDRLLSLK